MSCVLYVGIAHTHTSIKNIESLKLAYSYDNIIKEYCDKIVHVFVIFSAVFNVQGKHDLTSNGNGMLSYMDWNLCEWYSANRRKWELQTLLPLNALWWQILQWLWLGYPEYATAPMYIPLSAIR